ncbi:ParB/RepB/Spo0J family partition protein [Oleiagrimonas sp.]|jgi:ParB family chromosome partitioning protein|uniref:ParB/RepB/Spo0J family partition protein n=1 Tax=Oleiagrimonas sp. TaxID=2010330 RepID=UPI00260CC247|nr:ParB/RepB/Spo0J family partition protein [Oleiagrimonas sp.]MDA3913905.1 ParB/RepB/Spo0J family partition protein [Oleiagrimonas sp.]
MAAKKRGLGRGLDALLGSDEGGAQTDATQGELRTLPIQSIGPGKYQPRTHWDEDALSELADSIRAQGLIQPVVVRAIGRNKFELIAGERRWRAAQKAGLTELPALVRDVPEQSVLAMALIENIQRQELTPLEEANALERLIEEFSLTHQQAAQAVGRSRAAVSNLLRLLDLPDAIRELLDQGKLEMGHARALLTLDKAIAVPLARQAARMGWSVRELEQAVRRAQAGGDKSSVGGKSNAPRDPDIKNLENELAEKLSTRVQLAHHRSGKGKLVIHYHSLDELDGILGKIR